MEPMDAADSDLRKKRNVGRVFVIVGGATAVGGLLWGEQRGFCETGR